MREILFRGKSVDTGQWIEGDLINYADTAQIWVQTDDGKWNYIVDKETVCQYTGLTDKNGKKIFEGDILKNSLDSVYVVEWDEINGRYLGFTADRKIVYVGREPKSEVIGNSFDSHNLL